MPKPSDFFMTTAQARRGFVLCHRATRVVLPPTHKKAGSRLTSCQTRLDHAMKSPVPLALESGTSIVR
jgi:hypothetical protein